MRSRTSLNLPLTLQASRLYQSHSITSSTFNASPGALSFRADLVVTSSFLSSLIRRSKLQSVNCLLFEPSPTTSHGCISAQISPAAHALSDVLKIAQNEGKHSDFVDNCCPSFPPAITDGRLFYLIQLLWEGKGLANVTSESVSTKRSRYNKNPLSYLGDQYMVWISCITIYNCSRFVNN